MKILMKKCSLYLIAFCSMILLVSCSSKTELKTIAPFTEAVWGNTLEDIIQAENTEYETTVSVYGGESYIFKKNYLDYDGSVQYMFDDQNTLVGVAWFYIGDNAETATEIYHSIKSETSSLFGEDESLMESDTYNGNKWTLSDRSVLLVNLSNNAEHAVQISYISAEVNKE